MPGRARRPGARSCDRRGDAVAPARRRDGLSGPPEQGELGMRAIFVTVRMKPEYRDRILKGALEDVRGSRNDEPGCLRFDVIQDEKDPNTIYFYEVYR